MNDEYVLIGRLPRGMIGTKKVWWIVYAYNDEHRQQSRDSKKAAKKLVRHLRTLPHVDDIQVYTQRIVHDGIVGPCTWL